MQGNYQRTRPRLKVGGNVEEIRAIDAAKRNRPAFGITAGLTAGIQT